jgi:hypothetical protein
VKYGATRIAKYRIDAFEAQCVNQDLGASWQRLLEIFIVESTTIDESFGYHKK